MAHGYGAQALGHDAHSASSEITDEDSSWIAWFCGLNGNQFFTAVDEEFIQDDFNLTGLSQQVPLYDMALDTILDVEPPNAEHLTEQQQEMIDSAAELLYGLIHARFIIANRGLHAMQDKFSDAAFGRCHRVFCEGQPLLPVGRSDQPRKYTVCMYCARCNDIYFPTSRRHGKIDGAFFGTTFAHMFFMSFPRQVPRPPSKAYVPRVFGFRLHCPTVPAEQRGEASGYGADLKDQRDSRVAPALADAPAAAAGAAGEAAAPGAAEAATSALDPVLISWRGRGHFHNLSLVARERAAKDEIAAQMKRQRRATLEERLQAREQCRLDLIRLGKLLGPDDGGPAAGRR